MNEQQVKSAGATNVQPGDIVFECPKCGKSLAIDPRGAGLLVICTDCQTQVLVPGAAEETRLLADSEAGAEEQPVDLAARIHQLERNQAMDQEKLRKISAEIGLIQAALDRMVDLLGPENPPGS